MSKYLKVIYQVKLLNKIWSLPQILTNIPSTTWRYWKEFIISRLLEVPQYSTCRQTLSCLGSGKFKSGTQNMGVGGVRA